MKRSSKALSASKSRSGRPTAEQTEKLDEHLLDVAERMFLSLGFSKSSIEALADAAQASKKTIYHRYKTKEDLFVAVVERACRRILQEANPVGFLGANLEDRLEHLANHILERVLRPDVLALVRAIVPEADRVAMLAETIALSGHEGVNRLIARLLEIEVEAGHLTLKDPPEMAGRHFFSLIDGGRLFQTLMGTEVAETKKEARKRVKSAVALFLQGCRK